MTARQAFPFGSGLGTNRVLGIYRNRLGNAFLSGALSLGGHLLPSVTNTFDIGSAALKWRDLFLSRNLSVGGTSTLADVVPDIDNARVLGSVTGVLGIKRWADINGVSMQSSGTSLDNMVVTSVGALSIGASITTGIHNTILNTSQLSMTTGNDNIIIGDQALRNTTTGSNNIGVGASALFTQIAISNNIGLGSSALRLCTVTPNMAMGVTAGENVTTGINNMFFGYVCGHANQTGSDNTAVGTQSLGGNIVGTANISNCTSVGSLALNVVTGNNNSAFGQVAGSAITSGTDNTLIGKGADGVAANNGQIALGSGAIATAANSFTLGGLAAATRMTLTAGATNGTGGAVLANVEKYLPIYIDDGTGVRKQFKIAMFNA